MTKKRPPSPVFEAIKASLEEALAHAKGEIELPVMLFDDGKRIMPVGVLTDLVTALGRIEYIVNRYPEWLVDNRLELKRAMEQLIQIVKVLDRYDPIKKKESEE